MGVSKTQTPKTQTLEMLSSLYSQWEQENLKELKIYRDGFKFINRSIELTQNFQDDGHAADFRRAFEVSVCGLRFSRSAFSRSVVCGLRFRGLCFRDTHFLV